MSGFITRGFTNKVSGFHNSLGDKISSQLGIWQEKTKLTYTFQNYFHPFVSELLEQLNKKSVDGLLDVNFHAKLRQDFFKALYQPNESDQTVEVEYSPKEIDVSENGPYSIYNWELLFHVPLTIAVHLSKNQRFAEAQRWFHYIFDPTCNDKFGINPETGAEKELKEKRYWKFLAFRQQKDVKQIDELLRIVSKPNDECTPEELEQKKHTLEGYEAIRKKPFQPHAVARTRFLAYQYCTVMKYLDNLIAWGDSLFRQDTIETINEATQIYVLAANILGPKPQKIPDRGKVKPKTFAQLRDKLDPLGNALVDLEGKIPFNLYFPTTEKVNTDEVNPLFGIGKTLYFCIPCNDKLLSYWDTVSDRLFKIRHCMNIEGIVRQLPLFEPPIDPGMLVKAAAAGIDISSLVSGLNQPLSPVRSPLMIQKALELCSEVKAMGNSLLSALEKKDGEKLSLLRQQHEINIQQMVQDVKYLQWKESQEATESLFKTRLTTLERYRNYQRLLGKSEEAVSALESLAIERKELTEDNFNEVYKELVGKYAGEIQLESYSSLDIKDEGRLYLNTNEDADLNTHMPSAKNFQLAAFGLRQSAPALGLIPQFPINIHFWGIGGTIEFGGEQLSKAAIIGADIADLNANLENHKASSASKTSSYERRADDWIFQNNLAARELMQIGRQIISSLIREQFTYHEYKNQKTLIEQSQEIDRFLQSKFTNQELYGWMQGELSKLYYEYYKFAFDTARKAEQTMKHELMRPELDELNFIKFNYWDGGRKGLLSGEALYLDIKRMEMAYHDHNKREYELTKHVSLRQLDPFALLKLKATGTCEISLPEWIFDLDCAGHYMRRIKTVSLSIPSVTGPYTSINCTLSLLKSSLRKSSVLSDGVYGRSPDGEDIRFIDYFGTIQSIVTSNAQNDSGMFETNLREERFLPFEGAGAISTWKLDLPSEFRQFDYDTISDIIIHLRYTARQGGGLLGGQAILEFKEAIASANSFVRLFSLKYDFPTEWYRFASGTEEFKAIVKKDYFPYFTQGKDKEIVIVKAELYVVKNNELLPASNSLNIDFENITTNLKNKEEFQFSLSADYKDLVRENAAQVFLLFRYSVLT
ncbi:toxin [Nostoc sp. CHAB 5784]|uniref:Tc toxin subunit A-related protein n=1 Tax=Nostoc mirabile TaxID=2907820 RepID=UPI001E6500C6|nr:toxin [Nostoc mirabile]MCC5666995.1 toxin [Nostoc mirabile CHAB5784]